MENYCKLFLFPILIFQILFGCAEPSGGSGGSSSGNYSSTSENDSKNNNSTEDSSKKPQAISQDIKIYLPAFKPLTVLSTKFTNPPSSLIFPNSPPTN